MKLSEAAAFTLLAKYKIPHPQFLIIDQPNHVSQFPNWRRFVVKANLPLGGKKKAGLVKICSRDQLDSTVRDVLSKAGSVVVEEYVEHEKEYFLALRGVREGVEATYSERGGTEVEESWEKVKKVLISNQELELNNYHLKELNVNSSVREFTRKLIHFFQSEDATYLELNPLAVSNMYVTSNDRVLQHTCVPLGVVLEIDDSARFRHDDWGSLARMGYGLGPTIREKRIKEIDGEIKGSVKLVEVKDGGDTALLAAGAGAALFLADAIIANGFKLANYAEFSGNPPSFAITELTKQVCAIPGIKNLVIGSGIANFTPVVPNIEAIIEGLRDSSQAKKLNMVVRRCGPGEEEGIELMKEFAKKEGYRIQFFGRETGITEIVRRLTV